MKFSVFCTHLTQNPICAICLSDSANKQHFCYHRRFHWIELHSMTRLNMVKGLSHLQGSEVMTEFYMSVWF